MQMSFKKDAKKFDEVSEDVKQVILKNKLFDEEYYIKQLPQMPDKSADLLEHYLTKGFREGLNPSEFFDNSLYIETHGEVKKKGINPLVHYVSQFIKNNKSAENDFIVNRMIDSNNKNRDIISTALSVHEDYNDINSKNESILDKKQDLVEESKDINDKNREFTEEIKHLNKKIKSVHEKNQDYIMDVTLEGDVGEFHENCEINDNSPENGIELSGGDVNKAMEIIKVNNLFDEEYYNNKYPHVIETTGDLLNHYLTVGYREGMNPSEYFDTDFYLNNYSYVRESKINPLIYYALYDIDNNVKTSRNFTDEEIYSAKYLIVKNNLFDEDYYYLQCPELRDESVDPLKHYFYEGYKLNLNPSGNFNTLYYKEKYLKNSDLNPLVHYVLNNLSEDIPVSPKLSEDEINRYTEAIFGSGKFDAEYYALQKGNHADSAEELITHYVTEGVNLGLNPNKNFNTRDYLEKHPEIISDNINPFYHYLTGNNKEEYSENMDDKIQEDYKTFKELIKDSVYFDEEYYLSRYPEIRYTLKTPSYHYFTRGYREGMNPSGLFDNNYYLYKYPEVAQKDINPLYHFLTEGKYENKCKYFFSDEDRREYETAIENDVASKKYKKYDTSAPMVSIIILNYNGYDFIENLLNSIIKNTDYPNYEIIIVDNGSHDGSQELLKSLSKKIPLKVIYNKLNQKYTVSHNQAIDMARGEYFLFLDNDVRVLDGWLNHLMETALSNKDAGAVSSKIVYVDSTESNQNLFNIQHTGIRFRQEKTGWILPYNIDDGKDYVFNQEEKTKKVPAVAGTVLLIRKTAFYDVGGFDSGYNYGYEAVDLCLKLYNNGYMNYCNLNSVIFHYKQGSIDSLMKGLSDKRNSDNLDVFAVKWNKWLKQEVLLDKINKNKFFTDKPLHIAFLVLEKGSDANIGDYFIARGMAKSLGKLGYITELISRRDGGEFNISENVDVIIPLLNSYNIEKIKTDNPLLIKIAWVFNWFEWWVDKDYFESYDLIFVSNSEGFNYISENTGYEPVLFPTATDTSMFNTDTEPSDEYICDYCFAGNHWGDRERNITGVLNPANMPYKFNLYGNWWDDVDKFKSSYKGRVPYEKIPNVYASAKIVLDDATDFTDTPSSVNPRVFDAIASGRLVLSNGSIAVNELFYNKLPTYDSEESLEKLLNYYLSNPDKRRLKVEQLQEMVFKHHTYDIRAEKLRDILTDYAKSTKVIIKIPVTEEVDKNIWGDYHFAVNLQKEFNKKGYFSKLQRKIVWDSYEDALYDVVLLLRGLYEYIPRSIHYNIMWNISHPDLISIGEYDSYNQVYIASNYWADKLKHLLKTDVEGLLQCTDVSLFHREYHEEYDTQLLFVGNSRGVYRKVLHDLLPTKYHLDVYGNGWKGLIEDKYIVAKHISNRELYKAYSSTRVLLNDHWEDMREKGFISNRIFDAVACGAVVLTDHVKGIDNLFPKDTVVVYEDRYDINEKLKKSFEIKMVDSNLAREHTFTKRVEKIIDDYENKSNLKKW